MSFNWNLAATPDLQRSLFQNFHIINWFLSALLKENKVIFLPLNYTMWPLETQIYALFMLSSYHSTRRYFCCIGRCGNPFVTEVSQILKFVKARFEIANKFFSETKVICIRLRTELCWYHCLLYAVLFWM